VAGGTAGFLALLEVPAALELAVDEAVTFLAAAAPRVALAFSTMLDRMFDDALEVTPLVGETGRAIMDFAGDAGCSIMALAGEAGRFTPLGTRALVEVGDRIWLGWACPAPAAAGAARTLFLGLPVGSTEFSLSSAPVISSLFPQLA
jgi:hypothetical protein